MEDTDMKRIYIVFALMMILALSVNAKKKKELYILHSNDTHSCILPMNPNLADTTVADKGGFLRRITMLKEERRKHPHLLYIDSGDFFQGSPFYTMFQGDVEISLMNRMHLDATTLGNHEWDFGVERLAENLRMANFPVVCSNYDFTGTALEGLVKPYLVLKRKGIRIGIFAVGPKLAGLVDVKNFKGVEYRDPIECSLQMATMLKKEKKCDVVICISHLGWGKTGDIAMIKGSRYIDLVLGGHSHSNFKALEYVTDLDGREVPVDQNGKSAINIGALTLTLEK